MNPQRALLSAIRPSVRIFLSLVLLLAGFASMGNTLAQDLAWERWENAKIFRPLLNKG